MAIVEKPADYLPLLDRCINEGLNLYNGRFIGNPFEVLKHACKVFGIRGYESKICTGYHKIDLNGVSHDKFRFVVNYVKSHFFQVRFDIEKFCIYINEKSIIKRS
jgi:hypothetical protein